MSSILCRLHATKINASHAWKSLASSLVRIQLKWPVWQPAIKSKAGFAPKAARAIKKSSVWRHRAYVFCRQRFVCSHRARCDLLRRFLTCVEIHVHFVMHTSAYIDSLVITRCWSLNNIVQSLLSGYILYIYLNMIIHDNVTMDEVEVKNMEIAI